MQVQAERLADMFTTRVLNTPGQREGSLAVRQGNRLDAVGSFVVYERPTVCTDSSSDTGEGALMTQEAWRLKAAEERTAHWRRWGPYLSERQWGTVREDYSPSGAAWDFSPRSRSCASLPLG